LFNSRYNTITPYHINVMIGGFKYLTRYPKQEK